MVSIFRNGGVSRARDEYDEEDEMSAMEEMQKILDRINASANTDFDYLSDAVNFLLEGGCARALRVGDLPELHIEDGKVSFEKIPTRVVVRAPLSKTRHKYFTFLPEEGCTYLAEYLEQRLRNGEALTSESPVIGYKMRRRTVNPFIRTVKLGDLIRTSMRKAGVWKRPYVLRCYAETQLIIAESKGKISHPYLQFVAGHKGDIEFRYSTNKGRLPPDMIEDMRQAYRECEPFLSTVAQPLEQSTIIKEAKLEALKSIAKSLLGIDLLEVKIAKERERAKKSLSKS